MQKYVSPCTLHDIGDAYIKKKEILLNKKTSIVNLFFAFLRLGITSFGGPAMVAFIKDLALSRNWLEESEIKYGIVLCQSIPGAIAMQFAAYVGLRTRGLVGSLACYIGFGLPAFLSMLVLSVLYAEFRRFSLSVSIFNGLQVIVVAILFNAVYSFGKGFKGDLTSILFILFGAVLFSVGVSPFIVILISALCGIILIHPKVSGDTISNNKKRHIPHKGIWFLLSVLIASLLFLYFYDSILFDLASVMLQIDAFAFGGGFSSLPLMLQKVVHVHEWIDNKTFMDGIALGQITPGPIVITATFVGFLMKGILGAVVATIAMFTPSFLFLVIAEPFFKRFRHSLYFLKAMEGIFASFVGLILYVGVKFFTEVPWDAIRAVLGIAALTALILRINVLYILVAGTLVSAFLF
jgi:chromate transporter